MPETPDCSEPNTSATLRAVPDSFFNLELVSFQVENTIFRVPKSGFDVPGSIFEAMFALPASKNGEGMSNDNPIHLSSISEGHFRFFLRVLYPFKGQPVVTDFDDWEGVLSLSTLWEFTQIRNEAIAAMSSQISSKDVVRRIHLGRKFKVVDWIRDSYIELAQKKALKLEELSEVSSPLDWPTIAKIFYIRDSSSSAHNSGNFYHQCGYNHDRYSCPYGYSMPPRVPSQANTQVEQVFCEELEGVKKEGLYHSIHG